MVAASRPRKPHIVAAWMNQRRRYQGSAAASASQSVAVAALAEGVDGERRSTGRPGRATAARPTAEDRAHGHAVAAAHAPRAIVATPTRPAAKTTIMTDDADVVDQLLGDEAEEVERPGALGAVAGVHEQGEEGGQGDREERPDDRPRVHHPGEAGPVVAGDRVATGGGHELARLGLGGAGLRALAAGVARPQLLAREELVAQADLGVADHPPREGRVVADQRAGRRAVAAAEAGRDVGRAEALDVGQQVRVDEGGHDGSFAIAS